MNLPMPSIVGLKPYVFAVLYFFSVVVFFQIASYIFGLTWRAIVQNFIRKREDEEIWTANFDI